MDSSFCPAAPMMLQDRNKKGLCGDAAVLEGSGGSAWAELGWSEVKAGPSRSLRSQGSQVQLPVQSVFVHPELRTGLQLSIILTINRVLS